MKIGTFNIHEYLGKLYDNDKAKNLILNEEEFDNTKDEKESEGIKDGIIYQGGENKAYNWLKKEFQKGKTEVKVEMSSYEFKPGYHLQDAPKSTDKFPGMYGQVKTGDMKGSEPKAIPFPETKFPGSETKSEEGGKKDKESAEKKSEEKDKKEEKPKIKVEAKTKEDSVKNK